ncbi:MAG: TolC family protein [Bacteroidetes bacterium SW_8_64_56]|nr:MAG: TolC family protein [Bacteroidetes bacterium SW_8_64_56]
MMRLALVRVLMVAALIGSAVGPAGSAVAQDEPAPPPDTVSVTLTEALVQALEASPEVDRRRAQRRLAAARREEARANRFLTDVSLDVASSFAPGLTDFGDEASNVPEDLQYLHPSRQNDWSIDALRPFGRLEIAARQPLWTWVLLTKELDRLADRTQDVIDRAKREINRLLDEGDESVSQADLFQTRLTEEETKRRIVEIDQNRATARSALRRQLFLPDETTVVPAADELQPLSFSVHPDSLDYYIKRGLQNRPEVEQAEAGVKAREALVDVAQSDYYPKIGVQASLSQSVTLPERPNPDNAFVGDSFMGTGTRTGIGIQQNLNFGQTEARVDQAKAELEEVKHQQTAARQLVHFEVEEAYRSLITAKANVESRDRSTTIAGEWLRTEQVNFDLDLGDTEDLVKAVRADLEARARYLEAVKQYNVAVLNLLQATGTLVLRYAYCVVRDTGSGSPDASPLRGMSLADCFSHHRPPL